MNPDLLTLEQNNENWNLSKKVQLIISLFIDQLYQISVI